MNHEALDKFFERGILGLVLAILVFGPLAMGAVEAWPFLVVQALTIGVLIFWALRLWFSPKPQLLWPPICWAVAAFVIYAIARYWTAEIEYVARMEMIQVLVCAFLFFAIVNNLYRQDYSQAISYHDGFSGHGNFSVCGVSILRRIRTGSGTRYRRTKGAPRARLFRRTTWLVFWR